MKENKRILKIILSVISCMMMVNAFAVTKSDRRLFENIFTQWTNAFNQKNLAESCALFSKSVVAIYQGGKQKNYTDICNGFKKIFSENKTYLYRFKLHKIYQSENLAAVRITWYLQVTQDGKMIAKGQDEGIDIFERDSSGQWKIVNYLAYGV